MKAQLLVALSLLWLVFSCGNGGSNQGPSLDVNRIISDQAGDKMIRIPHDLKQFNGILGKHYYNMLASGKNILVVTEEGIALSSDGGTTFKNKAGPYQVLDHDRILKAGDKLIVYGTGPYVGHNPEIGGSFLLDIQGNLTKISQSSFFEWNRGMFCSGTGWDDVFTCSTDNFKSTFQFKTYDQKVSSLKVTRLDHVIQAITEKGVNTWDPEKNAWVFEARNFPADIKSTLGSNEKFFQLPDGTFIAPIGGYPAKWAKVSADFMTWDIVQNNSFPEDLVSLKGQYYEKILVSKADGYFPTKKKLSAWNSSEPWQKALQGSDFFPTEEGNVFLLRTFRPKYDNSFDSLSFLKTGENEATEVPRAASFYFQTAKALYTNAKGDLLAHTLIGDVLSTDGGISGRVVRDTFYGDDLENVVPFGQDSFLIISNFGRSKFSVSSLSPSGEVDMNWPDMKQTNHPLDLVTDAHGTIYALGSAGVFRLQGQSWIALLFPGNSTIDDGQLVVRDDGLYVFTSNKIIVMDQNGAITKQVLIKDKYSSVLEVWDFGQNGFFVRGKTEYATSLYHSRNLTDWTAVINSEATPFKVGGQMYLADPRNYFWELSMDTLKPAIVMPYESCYRGTEPKQWKCLQHGVSAPVKAYGGYYFLDFHSDQLYYQREF